MITMMFLHNVYKTLIMVFVHYNLYMYQQKNIKTQWTKIVEDNIFNLINLFK